MIIIMGESASGKTTLANMFVEKHPDYHKVVTYTTRPMREGEVDGVDYHFITDEKFNQLVQDGFFIEYAKYRDWQYGTAKSDCTNNKKALAVLTPAGMRKLKRIDENVISVYLYVDRHTRLLSNLFRGDNIDEAYRRNLSDVGQFDGVADEADYVIDNTQFHMSKEQTLQCLEAILRKDNVDVKEF